MVPRCHSFCALGPKTSEEVKSAIFLAYRPFTHARFESSEEKKDKQAQFPAGHAGWFIHAKFSKSCMHRGFSVNRWKFPANYLSVFRVLPFPWLELRGFSFTMGNLKFSS
ncbi:hypothetical protein SDJN03_20696, partial [Cucurbita argyrosperma subsp. sororia]